MKALERIKEIEENKFESIKDLQWCSYCGKGFGDKPFKFQGKLDLNLDERTLFLIRAFKVMRDICKDYYLPGLIMNNGFDDNHMFHSYLQVSTEELHQKSLDLLDQKFEERMETIKNENP